MEAMGGGIFAKTAKTPPYSRAFAGRSLRGIALPDIYAHAGINGNSVKADNDAARRVATSPVERENRF